jgi:hypothetical protein
VRTTGRWLDLGRLPLGRAAAVGVLLLVLALLIDAQANLYDQYFQPVWYDRLVEVIPIWLTRVAFLLVVGLAALVALLGNVRVFGQARHRQLLGLGAYLACAGLAYLGDYLLATGYVYSGYILRSAPLVVFFLDVFYAFGACIVVSALVRALAVVRERSEAHQRVHGSNGVAGANGLDGSARQTAPSRNPLALGGLAASTLLLVWMASYWAVLNRSYVDLFPPNQVGFLKQLAEPPYRGASVVSNAYAAPIAWYTQQWAYLDTEFGNGNVRLGENGYEVDSNPIYLWLADKQENPSYARPDYFVCFRQQGIEAGNARLHAVRYLAYYSCSDVSILRKIEQKKQQFLQHQIVAQDPVYPPQWAILKLDWEFPPYLAPFDPSRPADLTRIVTTPTADGLSVQVQYRYVQDDGLPEAGSTVRLYGVGPKEERCVLGRRSDGGMFTLPPGFQGTVQASVAPRSTSKPGPEIFGEPVAIGDGRADACAGR